MKTTTVMWGIREHWEIRIPVGMEEEYAKLEIDRFHDLYGGLLYDLNPEMDDADIWRELREYFGPSADSLTAGQCFEFMAELIAIEQCRQCGIEVVS